MKLTPKNWSTFQHYKHRSPPWIRLHRSLLDNYEFACLPVASKALAPCLWLLASERQDGVIEASEAEIAFRLRMQVSDVVEALKPLIDNGFFICEKSASTVLAPRKQNVTTEAETEAEADTEPEAEKRWQATARATWKAYADAYGARHGAEPVRNAKVNSLIRQFLRLVPADEAPAIAAHFVAHNAQFYVSKLHPLELLVADAAKLRTEWITGRNMTQTRARQEDRSTSMMDLVEEIKRERGLQA